MPYKINLLIIRPISWILLLPKNSNLMLTPPAKNNSSSESKSIVPAVSTEKYWILLYGKDVKSFLVPVIPWTFIDIIIDLSFIQPKSPPFPSIIFASTFILC